MKLIETFEHTGHNVTIILEEGKNRYWFYIDGVQIQYASNLDTARRLVTRLIDVIDDAHYGTSKKLTYRKARVYAQ